MGGETKRKGAVFGLAEQAYMGLTLPSFYPCVLSCRAPHELKDLHGAVGAKHGQSGVTVTWGHVTKADAKAIRNRCFYTSCDGKTPWLGSAENSSWASSSSDDTWLHVEDKWGAAR